MQSIRQLVLSVIVLLAAYTGVHAQKQWQYLGSVSLTGVHYASNHSLAMDTGNVPHVAYISGLNGVILVKYNGSFWTGVGIGSTGLSAGDASYVSLAFDKNNTPYVAYCDHANGNKATVRKYTGSGGWVTVGTVGFSAGQVQDVSLAIDNNNVPHIVYTDFANGSKATLMKYNGTNWTAVGGAGFTASSVSLTTLSIDNNNVPYVAYLEGGKAGVMKYNGTAWVSVGNAGGLSGFVSGISLDIDGNNTPYIAYRDYSDNLKPTVLKFNGTNWVIVGSKGFASAVTLSNSYKDVFLKLDNNDVPYVAFNDESNSAKATVMQYTGTAWAVVERIGIAPGIPPFGVNLSLAFSGDNIPYVAFLHNNGFHTPTDFGVMMYDCPPQSKIDICAVLTDTANDSNIIVWDGALIQHVDSFKIYREVGSSYLQIGAVPGNVNHFRDLTADAYAGSYKYKLTVLDSCGRESAIAFVQHHKTMRLALNYNMNDTVSLTWTAYEGLTNVSYKIKRSNNGGTFTTVDSFGVGGTDTTYLDVNPPRGTNRYRIEITPATMCSGGSTTYSVITSNTVYTWGIGAVSTEKISGKNIVMWDAITIPYVDSFRVYRADGGNYAYIASVAPNANSYTDNTATPALKSYKYKLTVLDIHGGETGLDSSWAHQTMRLVYDNTQNNVATIKWNAYKGIRNPAYAVKRSNNGGAYVTLAKFNISGSDTTYNDINPPTGNNKYRIDIALAYPYTVGSNVYDSISSNIVTTTHVGIEETADNHISVSPNPTERILKIRAGETVRKVEVYGLTGNKIHAVTGTGTREAVVDVGTLPPGMYLLKVNDVFNAYFIRK